MKAWQYITSAVAILCTAVLLITNILAAWNGTDAGVWRFIMLAISATADIGLIGFLFAMVANNREGNVAAVFMAFAMWCACGAYTGVSSMRWLEGNFRAAAAPANEQRDRGRYLDDQIKAEQKLLDAANTTAIVGKTELIRNSAKAEAGATRKRINELMKQKWPAKVEDAVASPSVEHAFIGYEWLFPTVLLIASQVSWFVTFGCIGHGSGGVVTAPTRHVQGNPEAWLSAPIEDRGTRSAGGIISLTANGTQHLGAQDQPEEMEKPDAGRPGQQYPRLVTSMGCSIDAEIADAIRRGDSERMIATRFGISRNRVRSVKSKMRDRSGVVLKP